MGIIVFEGNEATRYGEENEPNARKEYERLRQTHEDRTLFVETTGFWICQKFFMLGCSPDGIVRSQVSAPRLLEVKCPRILKDADPNQFDNVLTPLQLGNFPLTRDDEDRIKIKTTHSHYYQCQMGMDVMKMEDCDYVVWSRHGMVIIHISYDNVFWSPKRRELKKLHRIMLVPEYFLMRTPRNLLPIKFEVVK